MHHLRTVAALLAATALTAACGETTTATPAGSADEVVEVVGIDFGFEGLDEPIPAGSALTFRNGSDREYHEIAVMRIADDETRSAQELLELPQEEAMASLEFVGVASAMPGEEGELIDGDLTLAEPGRYVATCFVPVGADPHTVHEAFHAEEGELDGPPDLGDGMPHAFAGMVAEFIVE